MSSEKMLACILLFVILLTVVPLVGLCTYKKNHKVDYFSYLGRGMIITCVGLICGSCLFYFLKALVWSIQTIFW